LGDAPCEQNGDEGDENGCDFENGHIFFCGYDFAGF
jgi:hypothetical protein